MSSTYQCTYKKVFPVDEYGRLGGMYSLADIPIVEHKELTRDGIVEAKNEEEARYKAIDDGGTTVRIPLTTGVVVTAISERERV